MYEELDAAWLREIKEADLCQLASDFYERLADYLKRVKEENRMLDKKMVKAILLEHELENARRMAGELTWTRYRKILNVASEGGKPAASKLSADELQMVTKILPIIDAHQTFAANLLQGQLSRIDTSKTNQRASLRFKKEIPAIVGADMQSYGPFIPEDVASVPIENARILVKQGLAELIQIT
jgi:DNA replication initiation complex subunit (GINS family)